MHPAEQLKLEHDNILRGLKLLQITAEHAKDSAPPKREIEMLVDFFTGYADQGHHAKEEEIFFEYLYKKDETLKSETSPIAIFREDHVNGKKMISRITRVDEEFPFYVSDYNRMLNRHIEMENELFPILIEDYLTEAEIVTMTQEFERADSQRDLASKLAILDRVEVMML